MSVLCSALEAPVIKTNSLNILGNKALSDSDEYFYIFLGMILDYLNENMYVCGNLQPIKA